MNAQTLPSDRCNTNIEFEKRIPGIGCFNLRPLFVPGDIPLLHDWVTRDYARFWNMQHLSLADLEDFYRRLMGSGHACAYTGAHDGRPSFVVECYDPRQDEIGEHYEVQPGDRGMHILVAPAERPISGFTFAVMRTILEFIFSDPAARRVIIEPDIRNSKVHILSKRAGFRYDRPVILREKTAHIAFCTREQHAAALLQETSS
ncbi:MAG: acetyltransferase [Mesorhizobium sp.]|nr:MAG: acetyltransferase [Mesorhizobium sp.]